LRSAFGCPRRDTHPVRGIVNNRPFDFSLTERRLARSVRLGVIARRQTPPVPAWCRTTESKPTTGSPERDYLPDSRGSSARSGLANRFAFVQRCSWSTWSDPEDTMDAASGALHLAGALPGRSRGFGRATVRASSRLHSDTVREVDEFETESEKFRSPRLRKGLIVSSAGLLAIPTTDTSRIRISAVSGGGYRLALYVKACGRPGCLMSSMADTAFVGLGFSIDRRATRGQHVVRGCSHIYNTRGEGLQYR